MFPPFPASTPCNQHPWDPYGPNLIIIVGHSSSQGIFRCSASLLCHYSGYFQLTTTSPFFDAATSVIRLPGDSAEVFGMVHCFLLTRRWFGGVDPVDPVVAAAAAAAAAANGGKEASRLTFDTIIDLYAFGGARNMPLVQNAAADTFAEKIRADGVLPDLWSVEYLWEKTAAGAALRRMLVELVREMWIPDGHRHHVWAELVGGRSETPERLVAIMGGLYLSRHEVRISARTTRRLQSCEWHVHEEGVTCEGSEEARLPMVADGGMFNESPSWGDEMVS